MSLIACRICGNRNFDSILIVKEMMFGSGNEYKYYKCSDCGVLQIEKPVEDPKLYYSFISSIKSLKSSLKKICI